MKNDSFLSNAMDLPEEDGSCNCNVDGENEFNNGSNYNEGEALEAKQSGNVNSSPSQWPLRHNNHNESLDRHDSYSCNGFRQAKKPRYTYTGRISRIPSRYLDTDSDSGDGSARKDGQSRLKIKRSRRRRKLPSSASKLLANGFQEHDDALLLSVAEFEADTITDNLEGNEQECLGNVEYPDVFEGTSPISNDKISHDAYETQDKRTSHPNTSLSDEITSSRTSQIDGANGVFVPTVVDNVLYEQTAEHSFTSSGSCCVDISSKNNGRPRFVSLAESQDETMQETRLETDQTNKETLENCSRTFVNTPCKRGILHEDSKGDSSTRQSLVSPIQISKDYQVSCTIHNDSSEAFLERKNCENCNECVLKSSRITDDDSQNDGNKPSGKLTVCKGDIGSKLSKRKRRLKAAKKPSRKLASNDELKDSDPNALSAKAAGLDCLKDLKMRKAFAKKIKQKQLRRNEKAGKNDVLKRNGKNGVVRKVRQKPVGKVNGGKMDKVTRKKVNKVAKVKDAEVAEESEELDRVLGMRRGPSGVYEFLVEWRNGTSCWVSSDEIVTDKHNYYFREYLVESEQDVSVVNRVPFQAYCCDSLSLKECAPVSTSKEALKKMLCMETVQKKVGKPPVVAAKPKNDVSVEYDDNYCHITLNRETCKRKNTCLKIMTDLVTALEDAATSVCEVVIIQGLGSDVLCGLKLDDMSKAGVDEKEHVTLSQARYLVQTLTNYPKLLVALISKSAEGIGAVFLSLFDMICDEETWNKKQILTPCEGESKGKKPYTLPRLTGHSLLSEEILMGRRIGASESCSAISSGYDACLTDTSTVAKTLMEIETTLRLLGKETSLFRENGQFAELFPTAMPSFALFSDIKSDFLSEHEDDSCSNDTVDVERYTEFCHGQSFPARIVGDLFLADETEKDHKVDENLMLERTVGESSNTTAFSISKDSSHPVTEQNNVDHARTDHSTVGHTSIDGITMDYTSTDQSTTEHTSNDQSMTDDATTDQSTISQVNTYQSMRESKVDHTNTHHVNMEQSTMDHSTTEQSRPEHANADETMIDDVTTDTTESVDQSTNIDHVNMEQSTMDHSTTELSRTEHASAGESMTDDATTDQSTVNKTSVNQSTTESVGQTTNTDHDSVEQSEMDHSITEQGTSDQSSIDHTITDQITMDHTTTTIDQSAMDQEVDENKMLDLTGAVQTITACSSTTGASSAVNRLTENAVHDQTIDQNICVYKEADTGATKTIDNSIPHSVDDHAADCTASKYETANNGDTIEARLNHADYMEDEDSLKQAASDTTATDSTMTKDTNDVTMVNSDVSKCTVTKTWTDCSMTDGNELITQDKDNLKTDVLESTPEHVPTDHNTSITNSAEYDTSNHCMSNENTADNHIKTDWNIVGNDITGEPDSTMQNIKDKTSKQDESGDTEMEKDSTSLCRTQDYTNATDISDNQNSKNQCETNANTTESNTSNVEHSTDDTDMFEEQRTNEPVVNEFTVLDSNTSNSTNEIIMNDIDIDITNYSNSVDNCPSAHQENIPHAMTDPIHDNATEDARTNDNLASTSSATAAVDRYFKKLETQVEAEKRQAQQYIEQISRLWDSPFLSKNKL